MLVLSAMGMSFVHGSNDGQKGIGLIMLVLIGIVRPSSYWTWTAPPTRSSAPATPPSTWVSSTSARATTSRTSSPKCPQSRPAQEFRCAPHMTVPTLQALLADLEGITDYRAMSDDHRQQVRRYLLCLDDTAKKVSKLPVLTARDRDDLSRLRKDLTSTTEYAPFWVIIAVALALGIGTMVGWRGWC